MSKLTKPAVLESLEGRKLLSGSGDSAVMTRPTAALEAQAVTPFRLNVKFQPASSTVVKGFRHDNGGTFSRRKNGYRYGWSVSAVDDAVDRNSTTGIDQRLDSFIGMNDGNRWHAAVPNGTYRVRVVMGDPGDAAGADYRLHVEDQWIVHGIPEAGHEWVEGFRTVAVTDEKLTLWSDVRALKNKLNFVEIVSTEPPPEPLQGAKITWTRDKSFKAPVPRVESGGVRVGDKLYILGGFNGEYDTTTSRLDILDVKTRQWSRGADIPVPPTHAGVASDGKFIYAVGGQFGPDKSKDLTARAWKYDIANNQWSVMQPLPEIRSGGGLVYLNGVLHFFGGNDSGRVRARAEHWVLDVTQPNMTWQAAPPMPYAVDHQGQTVVNGQIYVVGGDTDHGISYLTRDTLMRYDQATGQWTVLANMPIASSHNETSVLTDGKRIFVLGGQENAQQVIGNVRSYNIAKNQWEVHASLPAPRKGGLSWLDGRRIYYFNGDETGAGQPTDLFSGIIG